MKKVVLITGASRGIGKATAILFAKNGFDVVLTFKKNKDLALETKKQIESLGAKCHVFQCDISKEQDIQALETEVFKVVPCVDVLVNNAGISIDNLFFEKTAKDFSKVLQTNLVGTFLMSQIFGKRMLAQKSGNIINLASTNGINTNYPMCCDYDASKAGIISLTHNLAMQFAPFVRVNCVAPGFVATESEVSGMDKEFIEQEEQKVFLRRAGTEEEIANVIFFLASNKASFVNSAVIRVDGGVYGE